VTPFEVVKGTPDDDELAAVVTALTIIAGRRKATATRDAAARKATASSWRVRHAWRGRDSWRGRLWNR
jgi:hypothetical protein